MKTNTKYFKFLPMNFTRMMESEFWLGVYATVGGWISYFVLPIQSFIWLMVALVFFDAITGIIAANRRKEKITAAKFTHTFSKMFVYTLGFLGAHGIELVYEIPMPYILSVPIVIAEFKSNVENIEEVTKVKIWSAIKDTIQVIKTRR